MSKIGEQQINIMENIEVAISAGSIVVKGQQGEITIAIPDGISVQLSGEIISVQRSGDDSSLKALHGLMRSLINNAVLGVSKPWEKKLEVFGTGYRAKMQGEDLVLEVGYSHSVTFKKVVGITLSVEGKNSIIVKGADKQLVGQVAHEIRMIKKPDVYKGKGVRYSGEILKLKPGKKTKTTGQ